MARRKRVRKNPVKVITMDLTDIHPYEHNPRHNEEAIESVANSIKNFGFLVPIVIDKDHTIVAGHTRYEAAKRLGLTEAPCIIAEHLTDEQIKAFRLIDNKVSELARWDMDMLADELSALENSGINFTEFGWTQEEIDCLTEVVADDCLSAGVAASLDKPTQKKVEQRAPQRTRLVVGEFVIFVDSRAYRRWASELRAECDYVESCIHQEILERLGLVPYIEAEQ